MDHNSGRGHDSSEAVLVQEGEMPRALYLIKFINRAFTKDFLSGRLRLGSVLSYRQNYVGEAGGRNDKDEHLSAWYQPDKIVVKFNQIELMGICTPVEIRSNEDERAYMLCMTAITDRFLNEGLGRQRFDPALASLGDDAIVIANVSEFVKRLISAVTSENVYRRHSEASGKVCGLVDYVDFKSFHGDVGPFRKSIDYAFQHEWRTVISISSEVPLPLPDCLFLNVGDLSDIATVLESRMIAEGEIVVTPLPGATPVQDEH